MARAVPFHWIRNQAIPDWRMLNSTAIVFAANVTYLGLGFLSNLIPARALSTQDFGTLSIAFSILLLVQEMCGGGLDVTMIRFASEFPDGKAPIYRAAFLLKVSVNLLLALLLCSGADWIASGLLNNPSAATPIRLAGLGAVGSSIYTFLLARLQAEERFLAFSIHRVLNNVFKFALLWLFWWWGLLHLTSAMWISAGVLLASSVIGLLCFSDKDVFAFKMSDLQWLRRLLQFGSAVVLSRFLFALYSRIDILFLAHYRSSAEVALYSAAANMAYIIDLCAYSIILTMLPKASRLKTAAEFSQYAKPALGLSAIFALALSPLFFLSPFLVKLLFTVRYAASADVFRILFIGSTVTLFVHPLYLFLYAKNKAAHLLIADASLVVVSLACNSLLTARYGIEGAAVASTIARLCGCAAILFLLRREWLLQFTPVAEVSCT